MPFNKLTWLVRLAIHKCRSTTITFNKLTWIGMVAMHVYLRWFRK